MTDEGRVHYYREQIKAMAEFQLTTLYVDYQHLLDSHDLLAKAVTQQYYRFDPSPCLYCVVNSLCRAG
jgi:DNA replication licensing factor MCM6